MDDHSRSAQGTTQPWREDHSIGNCPVPGVDERTISRDGGRSVAGHTPCPALIKGQSYRGFGWFDDDDESKGDGGAPRVIIPGWTSKGAPA